MTPELVRLPFLPADPPTEGLYGHQISGSHRQTLSTTLLSVPATDLPIVLTFPVATATRNGRIVGCQILVLESVKHCTGFPFLRLLGK